MRSPISHLPVLIILLSTFSSCGLFKNVAERNLNYRTVGSFPSKTPPQPPIMYPKDGKNEANLSRSLDISSVSAVNVVTTAKTFLGTPYLSGGLSKEGTDCSGLVYASFGSFGMKLPRTSRDMAEFGTPVENKNDIRMGDLVFFDSNNAGKINHVGLVTNVAATDANFVHATISKGVIESPLMSGYWLDKHRKTIRILPVDDFNNPAKFNPAAVAASAPKKENKPAATTPTNAPKKETPKPSGNLGDMRDKNPSNSNLPKKETPKTATSTSAPKKSETPKTQTPPKRLEGKPESNK